MANSAMIYLSKNLTVEDASHICKAFDCYLKQDLRGNVVITPRDSTAKRVSYRSNIIALHSAQVSPTEPPAPEAA